MKGNQFKVDLKNFVSERLDKLHIHAIKTKEDIYILSSTKVNHTEVWFFSSLFNCGRVLEVEANKPNYDGKYKILLMATMNDFEVKSFDSRVVFQTWVNEFELG